MPTPIRDALHTLHAHGLSKSQIDFHSDAAGFIALPETVAAATAGMQKLAELARCAAPDAQAFLRAFTDTETRAARTVVRRFSSGFKSRRQIRLFLQSLRKYAGQDQ